MPTQVAVLALDDVVPFGLGVPCQVFGAPLGIDPHPFDVRVCSPNGRARTCDGFDLATGHGLELLGAADLIVLPGTATGDVEVAPEVVDGLLAAHRRGARLASLCSGAFILAATGLLDGRRATTHWMYADALAARHPTIDVSSEVLFIDDGPVLTSAGMAAAIDLCLHIVGTEQGADVANRCARYLVAAPHRPGGQKQYIERAVPKLPTSPLAETQRWLLDHLAVAVTIDQMASHASMSRRSFTRRFRSETGTTPLQWLLTQRVEHARRLLETTEDSVDHIAVRCGMRTGAMLRKHFPAATGTTPTAYRRTFSHRRRAPA